MSFPFPRPFTGPAYFGDSSSVALLLGNSETAGLAIDFTASSNRLLIRNNNLPLYKGNAFNNDGGPVSFSRASLGTVVDSDGKVKWAAHNLLLASEQFDAASWTKTTTTVAANSVAAPNSTTTVETLTAGGANSTTLQSYSASAVAYTFGVWLKRKTGTGTIQIAADSGTWNTVTITADWALYTIAQTPAAGTISAGIRIVTSGDEVYAWGAHLYRSDLGGMQANASAYPMYNPTTAKNLLGFSESLTTGWTNTNTTDAIASEVNPVGLTGAVDVAATAGNGTLLASVSLLASPYTFSIWLKRKTGSGDVQITVDGTTYVTVAVTGAWTRFSTTLTPSAGTKTPGIRLVTSGDAVYAWGAMLSDSASLDPYVPNHFAAPSAAAYYGPRLDYDANGSALGLLVEEQRTNVLTESDFRNGLTDAPTRGGGALLTATSFYGYLWDTALGFGWDGATGVYAYKSLTPAASTAYTISAFVRMDDGGAPSFGSATGSSSLNDFAFVVGNAAVPMNTATVQNMGNSIYRVIATITTGASPATNTGIAKYITNSNRTFRVTGYQLEAGSFATSYIPTTSASVTRSADVAQVGTAAFPYSASAGTLCVAMNTSMPVAGNVYYGATLNESATSAANNMHRVFWYNGYVGGGTRASSSTVSDILSIYTAGTNTKIAYAFAANDFSAAKDGALGTPVTSGSLPTVTVLQIGSANGAFPINGYIRQLTYLPRRATNAELQQRTS